MTEDDNSGGRGINRRTVLKGAAAVSAAGFVGVPAFSGSTVAQSQGNILYGTTTSDGSIWEIDTSDESATELLSDTGLSASVNHNGNAYDAVNDRFYFTLFDGPGSGSELYLIDVTESSPTPTMAGTLKGGAASGTIAFYDNQYYYVENKTDNLKRVQLSQDGTIHSEETVADLTGNEDELRFGDIVFEDPETMYLSAGSSSGSYAGVADLSDSDNVTVETWNTDDWPSETLQLAITADGTLWGQNAGNGQFYTLDKADGSPTEQFQTDPNFADLAGNYLYDECEVSLFAGQDTLVGSVELSIYNDTLTVTYQTDDDWYLAETHLDVVDEFDDFPLAGNNNPKVGQFEYGETYGPGMQMDSFTVDVSDLDSPYFVAAHAVVYHVDCGTASKPSFWATEIEAELGTQKDGDDVQDKYADPSVVPGEPDGEHQIDNAFLSLGFGGSATVEFEGPVYNTDGDDDIFVYETTGSDSSVWSNYPKEKAEVHVREVGSDSFVYAGEVSNKDTADGWEGRGTVGIPSDIVAVDAVKIVDNTEETLHGDNANGYDLNAVGVDCVVDQEETAWGDGCEFTDKGNWATYTEFNPDDNVCGCDETSDDSGGSGNSGGRK